MLARPSLRRRLVVSYLAVVLVVTSAVFVTVQILVPQFFEQAVQTRLGPGAPDQTEQPGNPDPPGQRQGNTTDSTSNPTSGSGGGTTITPTSTVGPTTTGSTPTGSTLGPGGEHDGQGDHSGEGSGTPGGNPDPGGGGQGSTTSTPEAAGGLVAGVVAMAEPTAAVEQSPVPAEIQEDYDKALTGALVVATAIGFVIALALGFLFTRRLLGTLNEVKDGASRLASGHYDTRVPLPKEAELADLAESVNTLADSLNRTEQTRARLVSDLAHEIRNPLSTIEGYMEGLIDGVLPESRETYEAVASEAHRLKRLTRDLSTLSKAQEGAIEYNVEAADLAEVTARVIDALGPQYEVNDVLLEVDLDESLPVNVDADRIAQALTNLLGNALAHTPPEGSVSVSGVAIDGICSVAITDTGSGIPESHLETIFERFTRLDREQPGTGIGLNIARTLVRAHGGDVRANSPGPDQGSTFTLELPRHRES
ncbi:MAG: HAMP domain-containing sensor histidine kinase [Actinomycetota bacterium]|nr:HAMP domain-containing sensor histidine kinase [Actinomycetota bacterium]